MPISGNFSVLAGHEKKIKNARAARAARRRRAVGAERRRAALRPLSRYPFCASFQFLRGSTLPAALTMSMPLGSRRPRDGVRPRAVRRSCAAPRRRRSSARATAGRRRRRCTRRTGLCRRPSRADDGRLRACESWRKTLKTSRTHATYSSMSTDGRRVRRSRSSRSARPTSTQRTSYRRTAAAHPRAAPKGVTIVARVTEIALRSMCELTTTPAGCTRAAGVMRASKEQGFASCRVASRRATHRRSCRTVHIFRPGHPS